MSAVAPAESPASTRADTDIIIETRNLGKIYRDFWGRQKVQALESLDIFKPDIALLDIGMPGMDGYELARRIRATPRGNGLVLVALTGWGQADDKQRAAEAGFDEHLTKPVDPDLLSRVIHFGHSAAA